MRRLLLPIGSILLLAFLVGLGTACMAVLAEDGSSPTVTTDKLSYTPGETVQIWGSGFAANAELTVSVTRPGPTTDSDAVTTDEFGDFQYDYVLDGIEGSYLVEVLDAGTVLASTVFDDAKYSLNFQAAKPISYSQYYPPPLPASPATPNPQWANRTSSLAGKDHYLGQMLVFFMKVDADASADPTHSVTFNVCWETNTTSGDNFGYSHEAPNNWRVANAFLDKGDVAYKGSKDETLTYQSWAPSRPNCGSLSTAFEGQFIVTNVNPNDEIVVEMWVVLDSVRPPGAAGNVQAKFISASYDSTNIPGGAQTISLNKVQEVVAPPEVCDGLDNDGDTLVDEGFPDTDNDGIADCVDGCPNDPNKTAPGICGCGVADTDSDGDGTPDCNDLCPADPNKTAPGICGCGIADTDTDQDGTPDCNDGCPADPNKTAPGICGCGTPDTDSDGDTVADCIDLCPNDPNKTAPGICGCGTPDTDSDGDTIADCIDLCPNDPDNDIDGDGVCGDVDNCPEDDNPLQEDCNNNGVGDACDVINPGAAEVCDGLDNNCDGSVDEGHVCEADVMITGQSFVDPPPEIDVGVPTLVTLNKVIHHYGPYPGPVEVTVTKTATAPEDCSISPDNVSHQVVLYESVDLVLDEEFTIQCSKASEHTFTIDNDVSEPKEPLIVDPNMTNNSASTDLTVAAWAEADLVQTVPVPEIPEAKVSEDATLHLTATIQNTGPYGPVEAHNELTFWFPEDGEQGGCEVRLFFPETQYLTDPLDSGQTVAAPLHSLDVDDPPLVVAVDVIAHCHDTGLFPWAGSAQLVVDSPHVVDPDPTNNGPPPDDPIEVDVPFIDYADLKDLAVGPDWASLSPARLGIDNDADTKVDEDWLDGVDNDGDTKVDEDLPDFKVSEDYSVNLVDLIHNNGPASPVGVTLQIWGTVPAGVQFSYHCDGGERVEVDSVVTDPCPAETTLWANPGQIFRVTLAVPPIAAGVPVPPVVRKFDWHCLEPSQHVWILYKEIWPSDEYTHDPNPANNDGVVPVGINCIAEADAKITAQWIEGCDDLDADTVCDFGEPTYPAPSEIPVGQWVPILVKKTVHNNGLYGPVDLQTVKTATASPDCEVSPATHTEDILNVPVNLDVTHTEQFKVLCNKPSQHTFTFDNVISVKTPHVIDKIPGNNWAHTAWTVDAIATADLEVVAQRTTVDWPANIKVSESVPVTLETDVKNNGPYGSVEALFEGWLVPPTPCTVSDPVSEQVTLAANETKTIHQHFTIHCSEKCLRTFKFSNRITAKDPHIHDLLPTNNEKLNWLLPSVDTWAQADVIIVSQGFVSPPAEMQISVNTPVTLRKVLRNTGPYSGPVTVTITKTATAPAGCTIVPLSDSEDVLLPDNLDKIVDETFTIHCLGDGTYTFSVDNVVGAPHEVHVADPNLPNTAHTELTVKAIGKADVIIVSQQFVAPPAQIDVSAHVPVTLRKVLRNDGPYTGDVTVTITETATAPADCTIDPPTYSRQVLLPDNTNVTVDETFTIHCSKPSEHTFSVKNVVSGPKDPIIIDPNLPNEATTDLPVDAVAQVDVAVSQTFLSPPPTQINVSESRVVTVQKTLTATVQAPATKIEIPSVTVTVTKTAAAPAGCSVVPVGPIAVQKVVPTTGSLVFNETFTIHCSEPSTHGPFTFDNTVSGPSDAHVSDPYMTNNTAHSQFSLDALADVDVAVSQTIVSAPTEIDVGDNVVITVEKTITATVLNNPPYNIPTVAVTVTKTAGAPTDCSVVAVGPIAVQKVVPTTPGKLVYNETFTINCSKPSSHGPFTFNNAVSGPKDAHISDPNAGNNTASKSLTVDAIGHADMKVVAQYVETPPDEIAIGEDVPIVLKKVIHNNGPWGPVDAFTETHVTAVPADCTATPNPHIQQFYNLPVSMDIVHNEPFTIRCSKLGTYTFTFDDTVYLKDPHVHDPVPGNNSWSTPLTLNSVAEADVKITSASFVDPPAKLPYGVDTDITLRKHIHNNGPWAPVNIAITATATAPTGCTVVPKSVPSSISAVPVSIDQVVDEVWTIRCTSIGLKTFGFDNSIAVATPFVSDSNLANNSSHKLMSVMDDLDSGADSDGDGVLNGVDNCALGYNPGQTDADGDKVGDACDTGDSDADVFSDAVEVYVGTDPADNCPDVVGADDAWPLDNDITKDITVTGDVFAYVGGIGSGPGDLNWRQRLDLDKSGDITVTGDVFAYVGKIGASCM